MGVVPSAKLWYGAPGFQFGCNRAYVCLSVTKLMRFNLSVKCSSYLAKWSQKAGDYTNSKNRPELSVRMPDICNEISSGLDILH